MAKKQESEDGKLPEGGPVPLSSETPPSPPTVVEWIKCKVSVPNCHVGEIFCQIPGSTPEADKRAAACVAAAKARGIALNANGVPQFATAPEVEYLES